MGSDNHRLAILLFGPQSLSSQAHSLHTLRLWLHDDRKLGQQHWAIKTLAELPVLWINYAAKIPKLRASSGEKLTDILRWLTKGAEAEEEAAIVNLPNTLLTPLVVLMQLVKFERYLKLHHGTIDAGLQALRRQKAQTIGFCTGLLSSFVVASSSNRDDLEKYGAVAVRLAALVGAVVDILDMEHGRSISFATAWHTSQQGVDLARILDELSDEAYTSVLYDERKSTVTVSEQLAPGLLKRLRDVGITAAEVGLRGRFHTTIHQDILDALLSLSDENSDLQLQDATQLNLCSYTNMGGEPLYQGPLHQHALKALLVQQANWYGTFSAICDRNNSDINVLSFSSERCVPPSLLRKLGSRLVVDFDPIQKSSRGLPPSVEINDNDIAIVGLSIKVAGADDVDEFSTLLRSGTSQHIKVPTSRVPFGAASTPWRPDSPPHNKEWFGNFLRDVDAFDHRFFRRSPRESAAMDVQQRLFLQAAYQTVEMAGWFATKQEERDAHVGVYVGTCATDYEHHAACHPAGAFSATGLLRSFIAGKVSHFLGWTGPAMTFDTACSGSAVAIHTACRAMLHGECSAALCGGVNIIGSPLWFQNLAGASFLSPSGQCKPFDELADGYCRGEGIGCVLLRPMKAALADGDRIFGRISSTAVYQNDNSTPLFVPNVPSLSRLFTNVVREAGLQPVDISLVEAHGTGTPVGDPAEYQSIRQALGGSIRTKPLLIGSVKGLIGHTESTSGIASLIKIIIQMHEAFIPPQASYSKLSHHIDASAADMIEVPTSLRPWTEVNKAALINNYGASGSNASIIVRQAPPSGQAAASTQSCRRQPFWITGLDGRSIEAYCAKLVHFLKKKTNQCSLADVAFNIARQSNRSFTHGLIFSCDSFPELIERLSCSKIPHREVEPVRPVILCFGGQVSRFIGLDHRVYDSVQILRKHLDECDATIQSLGLDGIFPSIFLRRSITDTVKLQTMLFALQYACAKSWIDCGVKVDAIVGHSFGEITALCVSGVLSLIDAVKLIAGRARIVRDTWGEDPGSMMAVEADLTVVQRLLVEANGKYGGEYPASIACYNGPQSFTIAGSTEAMAAVADTISTASDFASVKSKSLDVTNAFHSALVEPLLPDLEQVGQGLTFNDPVIRLERATRTRPATSKLGPKFVSDHMRDPVFFSHAVQRLAKDYPSSIWLEAGSASTITVMTNRALGSIPEMHFQALNLASDRAMENLSDATVTLWNEGVRVAFWAHHGLQTHEYTPLLLPPYQFEKTRHWLEFKPVADAFLSQQQNSKIPSPKDNVQFGLWTFVGHQNDEHRRARFKINAESEIYRSFIQGHVVAKTAPICPATLEIDMAIEALRSLLSDSESASNLQPIVTSVQNHVALCLDPARVVWLDLGTSDNSWRKCEWKITTTALDTTNASEILCVEGHIELRVPDDAAYQAEFARFERLVNYQTCADLLSDTEGEADDVLQGRNVYRSLAEVVDYGEYYQGVKRVVGKANECAGRVQSQHSSDTWLDVAVADSCSQVAGIWVNCMTDCLAGDMFLATGCEMIMRSPSVAMTGASGKSMPSKTYHVFARHHRQSDKAYLTDLFVFDATSGRLIELMLGIQYSKVAKASMTKILTRLTGDISVLRSAPDIVAAEAHIGHIGRPTAPARVEAESAGVVVQPISTKDDSKQSSCLDIRQNLRMIVASVCGVKFDEIQDESELVDLGIDSLMGMELSREVESVLKCKLDQMDLLEASTFRDLVACTYQTLYGADCHLVAQASDNGDVPSQNDSSGFSDASGEASSAPTTASLGSPTISPADEQAGVANPVTDNASRSNFRGDLQLSPFDILKAFGEVKWTTDQRFRDYNLADTDATIIARSNRLCVALVVDAFERLGCPLRNASAGQVLQRIPYHPKHGRLVDWLYSFLVNDARLIDIDNHEIVRTSISAPRKSSEALYDELLQTPDTWIIAHKLAYFAGTHLSDVLSGTRDGISVLFNSAEGRDLVQSLYCDLPFNRLAYEQIRDIIEHLAAAISHTQGPLKILEVGAGTGGTTRILMPFLAQLNVPVVYTFTDLSPSMVVQARKRFKAYPFMRFAVHDIEKPPAEDLRGQHIILASNAVHATHDLRVSTSNIRKALRDDGFLLLTEMTEELPFVNVIFGLLEGWWLFDDGRKHALVSETKWETELHMTGFGHVDWTEGHLPENKIQRVIMALASGPTREKLPKPEALSFQDESAPKDDPVREAEAEVENYVTKYSAGFDAGEPQSLNFTSSSVGLQDSGSCIIVTGGTGSLGAHLVAACASHSDITTVICLNRQSSNISPELRQLEALTSRGITISPAAHAKLKVLEISTTEPCLGLPKEEYSFLANNVTHFIHNAWPMSGTRPLRAFEPQFSMLRNLLDLAVAAHRSRGTQISFQFVSSIGVVGHHPIDAGSPEVPEIRVPMTSVLPVGYCKAKWTCERILDETLHRYPERFRAMVVRPGQIAGSSTSGYWNPVEHFAFLVKSSQSLRAFPALQGRLQWVPLNDVAGTIVDLAMRDDEVCPVYHIDNPIGQPWEDMVHLLARELGISEREGKIITFSEWVRRVRQSPLSMETDNPALRLIDFLEGNFERMSCGGMILGTTKAKEHSVTLAGVGPVSNEIVKRYIRAWKDTGFLGR